MAAVFRTEASANRFDRLTVDVPELYRRQPLGQMSTPSHSGGGPFAALYRTSLLPLSVRLSFWKLLHRLRLDQAWFDRFAEYWTAVLGGRPLRSPDDFHFLRNLYRLRFQDSQVPTTHDDATHLEAWQQPELLFHLFNQVFLESLSPKMRVLEPLHRLVRRGRCLDFGSAVGSIALTDDTFHPGRRTWMLADVPTVALHHAAWRFRGRGDIAMHPLTPENAFAVPAGPFDAICCLAVFEHLPRPLETARQMTEALAPGGYLFFDYLLGDGDGLDTTQAVQERPAVIAYLSEHFDVAHGRFDTTQSMDLTIVRKKKEKARS